MTPLQLSPRHFLSPPQVGHWPTAVRAAETLRGTLVRCGPGHRLAAWPETPEVRMQALAPWLTTDRVAIRSTAAWIWGAMRAPASALEFSSRASHQVRARTDPSADGAVELHHYVLAPDELSDIAGARVTTRLRTVCDLLRLPAEFRHAHRIACRLLVRGVVGGRAAVETALQRGNRAYRRTALTRLGCL